MKTDFNFSVKHFGPRLDDNWFNAWGFIIVVRDSFAESLRSKKRNVQHAEGFRKSLQPGIEKIIGYKSDTYPRINFEEDTCLLKSFSVPGDCACMGLHHSLHGDNVFEPHNVDNIKHSSALLYVFTQWVEIAELLEIEEPKPDR